MLLTIDVGNTNIVYGLFEQKTLVDQFPVETDRGRTADEYARVKARVMAADSGTATTFDCITPKGEYLGGVIATGVQLSAEALFARAARLPRVEIVSPPRVVGRNTVHSMQSGIVFGYVCLVD